jgi:hypothetical protein
MQFQLPIQTEQSPAEAPGVMSLRKMEGPLGTVDLPVLEVIPVMVREPEVAPGQLEMVRSLR